MEYFYQLFLNTDDVILKLYTSLCQKAKCTLFGALYICIYIQMLAQNRTAVKISCLATLGN